MSIRFLILLSLVTLLVSCSKTIDSSLRKQNKGISLFFLDDVSTLSGENLDGYVSVIGKNTIQAGYPLSGAFVVNAMFRDNNLNTYALGNITVDGKAVIPDYSDGTYLAADSNTKVMRESFGKTIEAKMEPSGGFETQFNTMLYLPKELTYVRINNSLVDVDYFPLQRNATISWPSDPMNQRGVSIFNQFIPGTLGNEEISTSYDKGLVYSIITEDDGEFTLDPNKLPSFPDNSAVQLEVGRGNYVIETTSDNKKVIVYGYTKVRGDMRLFPASN
jgi:hypothetical protein